MNKDHLIGMVIALFTTMIPTLAIMPINKTWVIIAGIYLLFGTVIQIAWFYTPKTQTHEK